MDAPAGLPPAAELKACCVGAYESEWARLLAGVSWHPGGTDLTIAMARRLGVGPGSLVLDVASGTGTSALALARTLGCRVVGVDLSERNVRAAREAAAAAQLAQLVSFEVGDAERLPVSDGFADVAICECALCIFPDKDAATRELARAVRPGGAVGISDLTLDGSLPAELQTLAGWVMCVAGALSLDDYAASMERAGLAVEATERRDEALSELLRQARVALLGAEIGARLGRLPVTVDQIGIAKQLVRAAADAARTGVIGYGVVLGRRPA